MSDHRNKQGKSVQAAILGLIAVLAVAGAWQESRRITPQNAEVPVADTGWHMSVAEANAMARDHSEDLKSLIANTSGTSDDKVTVLMGAFCGRWVSWAPLMIDGYVDSESYPLLQYRETAKQLYGQLAAQSQTSRMNFDDVQYKACLVL